MDHWGVYWLYITVSFLSIVSFGFPRVYQEACGARGGWWGGIHRYFNIWVIIQEAVIWSKLPSKVTCKGKPMKVCVLRSKI